jgi:hypothetical protein
MGTSERTNQSPSLNTFTSVAILIIPRSVINHTLMKILREMSTEADHRTERNELPLTSHQPLFVLFPAFPILLLLQK